MSLVETAQLHRAPVQRVADSVARVFVPGIVAVSVFTWTTWYLLVFTWEVLGPPGETSPTKVLPAGFIWDYHCRVLVHSGNSFGSNSEKLGHGNGERRLFGC